MSSINLVLMKTILTNLGYEFAIDGGDGFFGQSDMDARIRDVSGGDLPTWEQMLVYSQAEPAPFAKVLNGKIVAIEDKFPFSTFKLGDDGFRIWRPYQVQPRPEIDNRYQVVSETVALGENVTVTYNVTEKLLSEVKASCIRDLNRLCERERLKYATPGSTQSMVYEEKYNEALTVTSDQSPKQEKYPLLFESIGTEVPKTENLTADFHAIAQIVLGKREQWAIIAARIEREKFRVRGLIDNATDGASVVMALDGVNFSAQT